jgi:outer membrane protein insertion porin family
MRSSQVLRRASYVTKTVIWCLLYASLTAHASAKTPEKIKTIKVVGVARTTVDTVLNRLELKRGSLYDAGKADRSLQALFATTQYKDVQITHAKGVVTVRVVENPTVADRSFVGNSEMKADKLEPVVKLKKGAIYTQARAHADALALRDLYRHEGRLTTEVEPKITTKSENRVDVAFVIREGKVDKVSSITFVGNKAFSAHELEGVIRTVRSSWLDIFKSDSVYFPERLDDDRELLLRYYLKHGFPDVRIVSAKGALQPDGKGYAVRYEIDEGDRFSFGDMRVENSVKTADAENLKSLILAEPGDVYDAEKIDRTSEAMTLALWDKGDRFVRVKPHLERDRSNRRISVTFQVEDGERLTVERIEILGNTKTREYVIRREMTLAEGQPYNAFILERDKKRIKALGFFKSVDVEVKNGASPSAVKITVRVVEDDTTVLSFGAGYSSTQGLIGDIAVEEHNLFGTGRDAKIKLSGSYTQFNAEAGFSEPHLLGTNATGGVDIFYRDLDLTQESSYKIQRVGGDLRVAYPLSDHVTGSVNYTFVQNQVYDVGAAASPAIKEAAAEGTYYTSSIGYAVTYDTRDSKKLPNSGSYFTLSQDLAGVGGDVRYIKSAMDARSYLPVSGDLTLVSRTTAGNISGWGGDQVRLLDMFYMGGETVRGFEQSGIGPRDTSSANQDALGGQNYMASTAEARFGLPLVPEDIGLRGAVFADTGTLFGTSSSAAKTPGVIGTAASLRASVGAGLIWDSPIGPLRADYAFPIAKQSYDKTQPFSFGIATF